MLSKLTHFAKQLLSRLSTAANQLFRRITEPAQSNSVTSTLADFPRSRTELLAENALLRQQLIVLHRQVKTPRLTWRERLSLLFLARLVSHWKQVLHLIKPDTPLRWHRTGFRLFWRVKSRAQNPSNRLGAKTIALIQRMAQENLLWGAERIRGELLKLDIKVAKRTIQKYMCTVRSDSPSGQSWSAFLKTHGQDIWARDFVTVVTVFFKTLYAFVIVHLGSRRVVYFNGTDHPTDEWMAQQLREATPCGAMPKHLICDNDKKYGPEFERAAKASGIDVIHTPYEAPLVNAICERFIGGLRRECPDHVLVLGVRQLVRVLSEYAEYFNAARPHQGIAQQTPESRLSRVPTCVTSNVIPFPTTSAGAAQRTASDVIACPVLNGLHHTYSWVT